MKTSHDRPQKLRLTQNSFDVYVGKFMSGFFFLWVHITSIYMIQGGKSDAELAMLNSEDLTFRKGKYMTSNNSGGRKENGSDESNTM